MIENRIKFIGGNIHKYYKGNNEYISVTTLKGKYVKPFNGKYWSLYGALRRVEGFSDTPDGKKEFNNFMWDNYRFRNTSEDYDRLKTIADLTSPEVAKIAQKILIEWDDYKNYRGALGTRYHEEKERMSYKRGYDIIDGKKAKTQTVYSYDLSTLEDGFYSELLVYLDTMFYNDMIINTGLAGQVDKCIIETINDDRFVHIDDYKTCAKISTSNKYSTLLAPLNILPDCDLSKFEVQLNLYGMILEQYGFKVGKLRFTHCVIDEKTEKCIDEIPYDLVVRTELMKELVYDYRMKNPLILK